MPLDESPVSVLYDENGISLAVSGGVATPTSASALLFAGITTTGTASIAKMSADGSIFITGSTTVIDPAEGVIGATLPSKAIFIAGSGSGGVLKPPYVDGYGSISTNIRGDTGLFTEVGTTNVLRVGRDVLLFQDTFDLGVNPNIWNVYSSSITQNVVSGSLFINSTVTNGNLSGSFWQIETSKKFVTLHHWPLNFVTKIKLLSYATGSVFEAGYMTGSAGSPPVTGHFVRVDATGSVYVVFAANGLESKTLLGNVSSFIGWRVFESEIGQNETIFRITDSENANNSGVVKIPWPNTVGSFGYSHLPFTLKTYNTANLTGSTQILIDHVSIARNDLDSGYDWEHAMAGMGRNCISDPATFLQATNYQINTAPANVTLASTASNYSSLGGNFSFPAPSGTETDYILFAYQIPQGYQLFLRTITINVINLGANINASTPTTIQFSLGVNAENVSLLSTSKVPRVIPLGITFADTKVSPGATYTSSPVIYNPSVPITCDSGKYLHIIARVISGVATSGQIVRGTVAIDGFFH